MKVIQYKKNNFKISNGWKEYDVRFIGNGEFEVAGFSHYRFHLINGKIQVWNLDRNIKKTTHGKICLDSDVTKNRTSINMQGFSALIRKCAKEIYHENL